VGGGKRAGACGPYFDHLRRVGASPDVRDAEMGPVGVGVRGKRTATRPTGRHGEKDYTGYRARNLPPIKDSDKEEKKLG